MTLEWSAKSGRLNADGKSLEWASYGTAPDNLPVIVMLHEGLGCLALWRDFPERLAEVTGLPVFAYSRAGYGQSDPADLPRPLDYMTREADDVLPVVLDAIGADQFILLGHSDGATIATEYAGGNEDFRVRGLILLAPHFFTEPVGLAEIARARDAFETEDLKSRMSKYHKDAEATFRGWNDAWLDPGFETWNVADAIDYLRIPSLVIQGRQDQYGTEAQVKEIEDRSYAPVDVLMLEDCKHAPFVDQPLLTIVAIAEFTGRLMRIETMEVDMA